MLPPLTFRGVALEKVWGGDRIRTVLGKACDPSKAVGEWWEIADRDEVECVVADGPLPGRRFRDLIEIYGAQLVGVGAPARFPLLVKWIDARETLSIQVHPDAAFAASRPGAGEPKTEMWYVVQGDPGASIVGGVAGEGWPPPAGALGGPEAARGFASFRTRAGDVAWIEAGCVHAIGAGNLLLEIQQNSDTTYRLYDWGRNAAGTARPLHLELGIPAVRPALRAEPSPVEARMNERGSAPEPERYGVLHEGSPFDAWALQSGRPFALPTAGGRPAVLCFVEGEGEIRYAGGASPFRLGSVFLVPAFRHDCRVHPKGIARAVWAAAALPA